MKHLCLLATCYLLLVTIGFAQWLEATIPVGENPWALCYNSLDNKVYCTNIYDSSVSVIDKYNEVIATVPAGDHPYALVYNPTNNKVYCA
ncbi:MAG: hypothetical protein ABIK67_02880, partial [candidate division WOR-3 bacterium]